MQHPTAGESLPPLQRRARQRSLLATRPICPRHALGTEDAHASARPGEGSHAGDPLLALNTDTEVKRKQTTREGGSQGEDELLEPGQRQEGATPEQGARPGQDPSTQGSITPPSRGSGTGEQERPSSHEGPNTKPIVPIRSPSLPPPGSAATRGAEVSGGLASEPPSSVYGRRVQPAQPRTPGCCHCPAETADNG